MTKSNTFSIHQFLKQRLSMNLTLRLGLIASVYFIYRFVLYFLDYTKFSVGLSAVFFIMCMCNFKEKLPRKMYSLLLTVIGIMLLYHDSYLPPPSSLTVDFTGNLWRTARRRFLHARSRAGCRWRYALGLHGARLAGNILQHARLAGPFHKGHEDVDESRHGDGYLRLQVGEAGQ